jgi:tetratricopeptide (TPR) repeat protein
VNRCLAWESKNQLDKAISDYNQAISLDPNNATAFNNRASAWTQMLKFDNAIQDCDEAIRLQPELAMAFVSRGHAWSEKKEHTKAINDYNDAIRLDGKLALAFYGRARSQACLGLTGQAVEDLAQAFELGYVDFGYMIQDTALDSVRDNPAYQQLIRKHVR